MSYRIKCPYCFEEMNDDEVMFRSERVSDRFQEVIPSEYDDIDDFLARYQGNDKADILSQYDVWDFFAEAEDKRYNQFWKEFQGTTEFNYVDEALGVKAYHRKVIDPSLRSHQKYLKKQPDGGYLIRDREGMTCKIELLPKEEGGRTEFSTRRVCRYCHNPFPDNYGKYPVKIATLIGITGAGKTVYLSQLLKNMRKYATNIGLSAIVNNDSIRHFLETNVIEQEKPLPASTPAMRLQQPLFCELIRDDEGQNNIVKETFVLYDVAGEIFRDSILIDKFAKFVRHSDGVIVLIDPMQIKAISESTTSGIALDDPETVLDQLHNIITGDFGLKCKVPFAICISKSDTEAVQKVLNDDLKYHLKEDAKGVLKDDGYPAQIFNAEDYGPIAEGLLSFMKSNVTQFEMRMHRAYESYSYFAVTALGCDVGEYKGENGESYMYPVGPVLPKRIEEPLQWLFYKFGYIKTNGSLPNESIKCPECGSTMIEVIPNDERYITVGNIFHKEKIYVDHRCKACGYEWEFIR